MTFRCWVSAFRFRGVGPLRPRFVALPAAPKSLGTRRCGRFSVCSIPSGGPRPAARVGPRPGRPACVRRGAHRPDPSGDGDHLRAVHRPRAACEDARVARCAVAGPAHRGCRHGLAAGGVRRRRRAVRASRRPDGRVPALPEGVVDRRTRWSSPASSTPCRARTWHRRRCSDRTHRCCWAALPQPALRRAGRLANGWICSSQHDL